jgi:hypothetical protein
MIKNLRNQLYAPKWKQAPKCGARGGEKNMCREVVKLPRFRLSPHILIGELQPCAELEEMGIA